MLRRNVGDLDEIRQIFQQFGERIMALDGTIECDSTYSCKCAGCEIDRQRAIQRGVRPSDPIPVKRKRAA